MVATKNELRALAYVIVAALTLVITFWSSVVDTRGQAEPGGWTNPVNLSSAGSASEPLLILDSNGTMRVLWEDTVLNLFVYANSQDGGWSEPEEVELPFGTRDYYPDLEEEEETPLFFPEISASSTGWIHALWRDDENNLFHSRVANESFGDYSAWVTRTQIAVQSIAAEVVTFTENQVHVVYIQVSDEGDAPAGVYYRRSLDNGSDWSPPTPLHLSPYFRLLAPEDANLQFVIDSQGRMFVAWDDWPNERVMMTRSADGGETWDQPIELDKRQEADNQDATGPSNIRLSTANGAILATWQAGHGDDICSQYFQYSEDGGENWQERQQILEGLPECATEVDILSNQEQTFLLAAGEESRYLAIWTENEWGEAKPQPELAGFRHPETFQEVKLTCGQDALLDSSFLWVASCGRVISQDVWVQSQSSVELLGTPEPSPIWQPLVAIESGAAFPSLRLVADEGGRLHAIWPEPMNAAADGMASGATGIRYARLDAGRWSRPADILSTPDFPSRDAALTVEGSGSLFAVWRGGEHGEIYFSRAATESAVLASEWQEPQQLTTSNLPTAAPEIAVAESGTVYVAYAVPINENRGVYLLKSTDGGDSWSEPISAIDGVAVAWEGVAEPRLAIGANETLHLLWLRRWPSFAGVGDALYYSSSFDGGNSWTQPQRVKSDNPDESPILWHEIATTPGGYLHRIWQEWHLNRIGFWHQVSVDEGRSWQAPAQVVLLDQVTAPAAVAADPGGALHLLSPMYTDRADARVSPYSIEHRVWNGEVWLELDQIQMDADRVGGIESLAAAAVLDQFAALVGSAGDEDTLPELLFTQREMEQPPLRPVPELSASPTPEPEPAATPSPEVEPTVRLEVAPENGTDGSLIPEQSDELGGLIIGLVAAGALLVPAFLIVRLRRHWIDRKRRRM